jgi:hypothetical protein
MPGGYSDGFITELAASMQPFTVQNTSASAVSSLRGK